MNFRITFQIDGEITTQYYGARVLTILAGFITNENNLTRILHRPMWRNGVNSENTFSNSAQSQDENERPGDFFCFQQF